MTFHLVNYIRGLTPLRDTERETIQATDFPDARGLLALAEEFLYCQCPDYEWEIRIRKRWQPDGTHLWAVYFGDRRVWDKKAKQFIHESGSALDSIQHLKRCRFRTLKGAWRNAALGVEARRKQEAEWAARREALTSG